MDKLIKGLVNQFRQQQASSPGEKPSAFREQDAQLSKDLEQVWTLSGQYKSQTPSFDTEANFAKFKARTANGRQKERTRIRALWVMRSAAAILLLIVGLWTFNTFSSPNIELAFSHNTGSELMDIRLSDGSYIQLFPEAKLEYPTNFGNASQREVVLSGKAHFEVSADPSHPFIIQTTNTRVKVVGTQFLLAEDKDEDQTTISVTEGKVEFMDKTSGDEIKLTANEMGICREGGFLEKEVFQSKNAPKTYNMQGKSVAIVVLWLESVSELKLDFSEKIKDCMVSGFFTVDNAIEKFEALGFNVKEDKNGAYLISGDCQ